MANFFDLPIELRTEIYLYLDLIDWDQTFSYGSGDIMPKLHNIKPSILLINKAFSYDAGVFFSRYNPVQIWIEVDYEKPETIDNMLEAALTALTKESDNGISRSWQCLITIHVCYGVTESEIYESRLVLYEKHTRYPTLPGAPPGKDILAGWRQWFSGGTWRASNFYVSTLQWVVRRLRPAPNVRTLRDHSWKAGAGIAGEDFVAYLQRLVP